jgi:hypothetical protein
VRGIFSGSAPNPEFDDPDGVSLKFAIGPIVSEHTVREQQRNLERIAAKHGHIVQRLDYITIRGKEHATMTCTIPSLYNASDIKIKNYSIIYCGTEYLVTARIDRFSEEDYDRIVETFRLL